MDTSLITLAEKISTHGWVLAVFLIGFIGTFVCSIFCTIVDRNVKEIVKLCGAFAIILIALDVNNIWLYALSIVIVGTVVASENFMLKVYSIFRANNSNMHAIVAEVLRAKDQASIEAQDVPTLIPGEPTIGTIDVPTEKI